MGQAESKSKTSYKLYRHRNPITMEVFYVGIGRGQRPKQWWSRNEAYSEYVKKHGKPIMEVVKENLSKEEAYELEELMVMGYGRVVDNSGTLVNIEFGKTLSNETKKILSEIKKGIPKSEEMRANLSRATKGKKKSKSHREAMRKRWEKWRIENNKN